MKNNRARLETKRSAKSGRNIIRSCEAQAGASVAKRARIVVADDHPMTRAGVVQLINGQPDLQVHAEAGSPAQVFEVIAPEGPELLLTDMTMPGRSGIEFIKDILAVHPKLPILILSMHDETIYAERALRAGARGYIMKEAGGDMLLTAIRSVLKGQVYVSVEVAASIVNSLSGSKPRNSHSPIEKLTDREFEVFQLIGSGKSTREIALQLHLSPKTVDVHRGHIKEKLENRPGAACGPVGGNHASDGDLDHLKNSSGGLERGLVLARLWRMRMPTAASDGLVCLSRNETTT